MTHYLSVFELKYTEEEETASMNCKVKSGLCQFLVPLVVLVLICDNEENLKN